MENAYQEQLRIESIKKVRELVAELPEFATDFFRAMKNTKRPATIRSYAYDLNIFFYFLKNVNPYFKNKDIRSLPVSILDQLKHSDIEEYLEFLEYYEKDGKSYTNQEEGKARKLATLNTFFNYYYKNEIIKTNAPARVQPPKIHEKNIIRLDPNEVSKLIDAVESGEKLNKNQKNWHHKFKSRDLAIITTLLGTGIRVTELVGLDLNHIDFDNGALKVIRKGGDEDLVYYSPETEEFLIDYMDERLCMTPEEGHENALFISRNNTRITARSVERLVKKYASSITPKHITPHKMRSTYGSFLYEDTGDIYLVADSLGHKSVEVAKKRYVTTDDKKKRQAARNIRLRKD